MKMIKNEDIKEEGKKNKFWMITSIALVIFLIIGVFVALNDKNVESQSQINELEKELFHKTHTVESAREYRMIEDYRNPINENHGFDVFLIFTGVGALFLGLGGFIGNLNKKEYYYEYVDRKGIRIRF